MQEIRTVRGPLLLAAPRVKFLQLASTLPAAALAAGPAVAPADYGAYSASNYEAFQAAQVDRAGVVYIGSNGGGLHAFNAETGHEKWMFIPNNLMSKLQDLQDDEGDYRQEYMMDGPIVVQDVYNENLGQWRTVLIAGQAKGVGGDGFNYYYALDVTDPGMDPNAGMDPGMDDMPKPDDDDGGMVG